MKKLIKKSLSKFGLKLYKKNVSTNFIRFEKNNFYQIEYENIKYDNNTYFIPKYASHRPAVINFLQGKLYEPITHQFVKYFCSKFNGSIIHAGTFFGDMLPSFSKYVSNTIYAFEPVLENFVLSKLTVEKNNLSNVIIYNSALSEKIENLRINTMDIGGVHRGGSSNIDTKGVICGTMKIDSLKAQDIILIHLDIEGHELFALKGALETIKLCKPVIAIEDNTRNCSNYLIEMKYELIKKIPGLNLWAPSEDINKKSAIIEFVFE